MNTRPACTSAHGYRGRAYAESLGMATRLLELPACGGHLLVRPIAGSGRFDACGAYPVFSCDAPARLPEDIAALAAAPQGLVSATLVADPLLDWDASALRGAFPHLRELAPHHVIDLDRGALPRPSSHHRRKLRQAAAHPTEIRVEADPRTLGAAWAALYEVLVSEVGITGLRRFSRAIFERMLVLPGTVVFTAWEGDELLGADWYLEDGDRVYAHLSAYAVAGYARAVSYPMLDFALRHFAARGARVLDLGGVPLVEGGGRGLAQFKQGWATRALPAWLCGRVLDAAAYARLGTPMPVQAADYFPRYRWGEYR
jgi:hypothetical protein